MQQHPTTTLDAEIFRRLAESCSDAIGIAYLNSYICFANSSLRHMMELDTDAELESLSFYDYLPESDREYLRNEIIPLVESVGEWNGKLTVQSPSGKQYLTQQNIFLIRDDTQCPIAFASIMVDITKQERNNASLRIGQAAIETSLTPIAMADLAGHFTYTNPAFNRLWRLPNAYAALGRSVLEFWVDLPRASAALLHLQTKGFWKGELEALCADGTQAEVELSAHTVKDAKGQPLCLMGSFVDVTARNCAERQLQLEHEFASGLLNTAPMVMVLLNLDGTVQYINPYFERLSGYRVSEVQGADWFDTFLPDECKPRIRQIFTDATHEKSTQGNINPVLMRDGSERLIEWHDQVLKGIDGGPKALLAVGVDVTERQQKEEQLRHLNEQLEQRVAERSLALYQQNQRNEVILNTTPDGFLAVDVKGVVRHANPAFCTMLDYGVDEIGGLSINDLEAVEGPEAVAQRIRKILGQGHERFETRLRGKHGRVVDVEVTATLVDLDDEKILYGFTRDITERKYAEQALILARDEAQRANTAKSEFLSRMSHELRTPLNAILGFTQLLQFDDNLEQEQQESLQEIMVAGKHLLQLVNEVLDLARVESGHLQIRMEPVNVGLLIDACVAQLKPISAQRGIEVLTQPLGNALVMADEVRLKQVMFNLLSNAIKYNQEHGQIRITYTLSDEWFRIKVTDRGMGIPVELQSRLFKPFERLVSAYQAIEGTGIGLALAKKLIEAMGGNIGVESSEGNGSTFWVELPAVTGMQPFAVEPALGIDNTSVTASACDYRILYIEDNPANLRLVQKLVERRGDLAFGSATSGEAGLELIRQWQPDLVLLDINLPGMDGHEVLRQLLLSEPAMTVPVVAVSANAMPQDIEIAKQNGFQDYLTKPINIKEFYDLLERHLGAHKEIGA